MNDFTNPNPLRRKLLLGSAALPLAAQHRYWASPAQEAPASPPS